MAVGVEPALVRVCDLAGRPRGTAFPVDDRGTLLTSHEAIDSLVRLVLHLPDGRRQLVESDRVTALPGWNLALLHTAGGPGGDLPPLLIGSDRATDPGTAVRLRLAGWTQTVVAGSGTATYTATDRFHPVPTAVHLALSEAECVALRLNAAVTGGPVLDATTGAVLAVLGTALHAPHRGSGFAVPLWTAAAAEPGGPLDILLRRNGRVAPGFGTDLNLAGALQLTDVCLGPAARHGQAPPPGLVARPEVAATLTAFENSPHSVLALVGAPGTGRTTALAEHTARRRAHDPAAALWLRGADLAARDDGLRDACTRHLVEAGRRRATAGPPGTAGSAGDPARVCPDVVARLARDAGQPLLVVLDAPEEMPSALTARLGAWTAGTADWLRAAGARLVLACRPAYWEQAGALFPADMLHSGTPPAAGPPAGDLPPCQPFGDLPPGEATRARAALGLTGTALAGSEEAHPLSLRLLARIRAAQPAGAGGTPARHEIFSAHLDLAALRVAEHVARVTGTDDRRTAPRRPAAQRRCATRAAARLHAAARAAVAGGHLTRGAFDRLFPRSHGWAEAVLAAGVLTPAGTGYRFADEEFADWLQGRHLDLDATLGRLLGGEAARHGVPRHRIGTVVQALLRHHRELGPHAVGRRLTRLAEALTADDPEGRWWAEHLLWDVLLTLPDATAHLPVLRMVADRIAAGELPPRPFGPGFWRRLRLSTADRLDLLRRLLPADGTRENADRYLTVAADLLAAEPRTVQPVLCRWFDDTRPLPAPDPGRAAGGAAARATVAGAAQALLHTHRGGALDELADTLVATGHPRADELLDELAHDEPAALARAVHRWAGDERTARRVAAATYARRLAARATGAAERDLLRRAADRLLDRSGDAALHSTALGVLVTDPAARPRCLAAALRHFATAPEAAAGELAPALAAALSTHPEPVLSAFRSRLVAAHTTEHAAHALLAPLAAVRTPALARPVAHLVREYAARCPVTAVAPVAGFVDRRLEHGRATRAVLRPLVGELLRDGTPALRRALGRVLGRGSEPLRAELLDVLLAQESDPAVLDVVRDAVAAAGGPRDLLQRISRLRARGPSATAERRRRAAAEPPGAALWRPVPAPAPR